ncbi:MAG: histidinol phosphate phosphatase [Melioribacteraceae bacterium]|nr:MAG: histidinol phosphate phosphatase [Melioribacteraceae bacterium]
MKELKEFTKLLAEESGKIIKSYFRSDLNIERKPDKSPVTIADKKAEEIMRELIMKNFPEHGILGEEFGEHNPDAEYKWILDPIDGTKSFIHGTVTFGTLIGLLKNNEPILGVINQPIMNDFMLGDNVTTELNSNSIKVNNTNNIADASLMTTDQTYIRQYHNIDKFLKLTEQVKLYRMWGDCYGYMLLAMGYADIMIDPIMHIWDTAALVPVVQGAGGIITDYFGNDVMKGESVIASTPGLHSQLVKMLN